MIDNILNSTIRQQISEHDTINDKVLKYDTANKTFKKLANLNMSLEYKQDIVESTQYNKNMELIGYEDAAIIGTDDGDTFTIKLNNGSIIKSRLSSDKIPFIDTIEMDHNDNKAIDAINNNPYKRNIQPSLVATLLDKDIAELTNDDYNNVAKYQQKEVINALTAKDNYKINKNINNEYSDNEINIPIKFKNIGSDAYGRVLGSYVNPNTRENISDMVGRNAYMNANFDIYDAIDNGYRSNSYKEVRHLFGSMIENFYNDRVDTDGRISESLDMVQSSAYQSAARFLNLFGKETFNGYQIADIIDPVKGQELADIMAGVKISTREDYLHDMLKSEVQWSEGDYSESMFTALKNIDRILAESAVQTGTIAVAGIAAAATGGIAAPLLITLAGSMLASLDMTTANAIQFEHNNGIKYSPLQYLIDFGVNTALLVPDILLTKGIAKFATKPLREAMLVGTKINKAGVASTVLKNVAKGSSGEAAQEYAQGIWETYTTQDITKAKGFKEIATDSSQVWQGALGGLVGGTLAGTGTAIRVPAIHTKNKLNEKTEKALNHLKENYSFAGLKADKKVSEEAAKIIQDIEIKAYTPSQLSYQQKQLNSTILSSNINYDTIIQAQTKETEILIESLINNKKVADNIKEEEKQEVLEKILYRSDPKVKNNEQRILDAGKALGFTEEHIRKTAKEVDYDVKYGLNVFGKNVHGYIVYKDNINTINRLLKDTRTTEEQKVELNIIRKDSVNKLRSFADSQVSKIQRFVNGVEELINTPTKNEIEVFSPMSKPFVIKKSDILSGDLVSNPKMTYSVINSTVENINNIHKILNDVNEAKDYDNKVLEKVINAFNNVTDTLKNLRDNAPVSKKVLTDKEQIANKLYIATNAFINNNLKDGRTYRNIINQYDKSTITDVIELLKTKDSEKYSKVITQIEETLAEKERRQERTKKQKDVEKELQNKEKSEVSKEINDIDTDEVIVDFDTESKEQLDNLQDSIPELSSAESKVLQAKDKIVDFAKKMTRVFKDFMKNESEKQLSVFKKIQELEQARESYIQDIIELTSKQRDILEENEHLYKEIQKLKQEGKKENKKQIEIHYDSIDFNNVNAKELQKQINTLYTKNVAKKEKEINDLRSKIDGKYIQSIIDNNPLMSVTKEINNIVDNNGNLIKDKNGNIINDIKKIPEGIEYSIRKTSSTPIKDIIKISDKPKTYLGALALNSEAYPKVIQNVSNALNTTVFNRDNNKKNLHLLPKQVAEESPALALIANDKGEIDPNIAFTIDYTAKEFLIHYESMIRPTNVDDIARLFGYENKIVPQQVIQNALQYGSYRQLTADKLGNMIMDNLGITASESAADIDYKRLVNNLGNYAIMYMESKKWVIDTAVQRFDEDGNIIKHNNNQDSLVHMIKSNITPSLKHNMSTSYNKYDFLRIDKVNNNVPMSYPLKPLNTFKTKHNKGFTSSYSIATDTLNKLRQTAFEINEEGVDFLINNPKLVREQLGIIDPEYRIDEKGNFILDEENNKIPTNEKFIALSYTNKISQLAINDNIEREIQYLIDLRNTGKTDWYLDWFFSRNGRFFANSSTVNPQASKLHRFLFTMKYKDQDLIVNMDDLEAWKYAIAQAFSFSVDNKLDEDRNTFVNKIIDIPVTDIEKALLNGTLKELGIEKVENLGHFLVGLQSLRDYQNAIKNNETSFKSKLLAEFDSTTSGYAIKLLQFADPSLAAYYEKVGIQLNTDNPTEIHNLKGSTDFLDIYKSIAKSFELENPDTFEQRLTALKNDDKNKYLKAIGVQASKDFKLLHDSLPKVAEDGNIPSELRKLFKEPTMTFLYGVGRVTLSNNLGVILTSDLINTYLKGENESINKFFSQFDTDGNLKEVIRTKALSSIIINIDGTKTNLEKYLNTLLSETYGKSVWNALETEFKPFIKVNFFINTAFNIMFNAFEKKYIKEVKKLIKEKGRDLSIEEDNKVIESLFNIFPVIHTVYSETLNEGVTIYDTEYTMYSDMGSAFNPEYGKTKAYYGEVSFPNKPKGTRSVSLSARLITLKAAVNSGAVVPIHYIDGAVIAASLRNITALPVHDAEVLNIKDQRLGVYTYNKELFIANKNYNLFDEITNRLKDVSTENMDTVIELFDSYNFLDAYMITTKDKGKTAITVEEFIEVMSEVNDEIQINRDKFYSKENMEKMHISNMDGISKSYFSANDLTTEDELQFKKGIEKEIPKYGSDPFLYTTDATFKQLRKDSLASTETRLEILDRLNAIEPNKNSKEYLEYVKEFLSIIDTKKLENTTVWLSEQAINNEGYLVELTDLEGVNLNKERVKISVKDTSTPISYSDKSAVEIYAHEIVHSLIGHVTVNAKNYNKTKELKQLMNLYDIARKHITVADLMPDTILDIIEDTKKATILWDYIFDNPNIDNLEGLNEFAAHGLTNQKIINKLKELDIKENKEKVKFLDKLISVAKTLLDVLSFRKPLEKIFPTPSSLISGDTSADMSKVYYSLRKLMDDLSRADEQAINKLKYPIKAVESVFNAIGTTIQKGNEFFSPKLKYALTIADKKGLKLPKLPTEYSKWEYSVWLTKVVIAMLASDNARMLLPSILRGLGLRYEGSAQTVIRDMSKVDEDTSELDSLSLFTRKAEQTSKNIENIMYKSLIDVYDKTEWNEREREVMTTIGLHTDLSMLLNTMSYNEIKDMLLDDNVLKDNIQKIENQIKNKNKEYYDWYTESSKALAYYMVTGIGDEGLLLNAHNIAVGVLLDKKIDADQNMINDIDKLVTLYAVLNTAKESKNVFVSLGDAGNENLLKTHQAFVKLSKDSQFKNEYHVIKGYTKQLYDTSIDIKVAPVIDAIKLKKEGYELVSTIHKSKVTNVSDLGIYKNILSNNKHRNGATVMFTGQYNMGTSLDTIARQELPNYTDDENVNPSVLKDIYTKRAKSIQKTIVNARVKGKADEKFINSVSGRFVPVLNLDGNISDFRITMNNETKQKVLGQNLDGFSVLSKMFASQSLKLASIEQNKNIFKFLLKMMKQKYTDYSITDTKGKEYIELSKDSIDPFVNEVWDILPREFKKAIQETGKPFMVRQDWLTSLFGISNFSMIDIKALKYSPTTFKRLLQITEAIMQFVGQVHKVNIVIRTPAVLFWNMVSNFNIQNIRGTNPAVTLKLYFENAKNLREYITNKRELDTILIKKSIGTATEQELKSINWYKAILEHNPIHPLMEKGMYQNIIEDMSPEDLNATGKASSWLNKKTNKIPSVLKKTVKHAYMLEGTPVYQVMYLATQYSDFIARATDYQLGMDNTTINKAMYRAVEKFNKKKSEGKINQKETFDKAKFKETYEKRLFTKVLNTYINYDKPQSKLEQYLNDMGLVMFTKFFKRIQSILTNEFIENPISALLFIASQFFFIDTEDIFEQNLGNKNFNVLFFSPFDNAASAITPSAYRWITLDLGF